MFRDVSSVVTTTCTYIRDDKTLVDFDTSSDTQTTYTLISNKYLETNISIVPNGLPSGSTCYTTTELEQLPSTFDFIQPIYEIIAIVSVVTLFLFAYRLILHPFWSKS
jgi:hypothetical protein